jgi:hypothetical protein
VARDVVADPWDVFGEVFALDEAEETGRRQPFMDWAMAVPEPKTGPLDFDRFPFQRQLYEQGADDKEMVVKKATQVGVSTYLLRWTMYHADIRGLTALYVFPKRHQMYDFADARIKAAIQGSQYLKARIPSEHVNNKGLKRIGVGHLYCRGSESRDDLQSIDADVLCLDEYDDLRVENIPDAERRLSGSRVGLLRRVGVPSIPGFGLDKLYDRSDQRRWYVKCPNGHQQPLDYGANVDEDAVRLVCGTQSCRKPLDVRKGEWVVGNAAADVRGYHVPRLVVPGVDLRSIIEAHYKTSPYERQVHHNKDLGEAYAPAEGRLTLDALESASRAEIPLVAEPYIGGDLVTGGIDVASTRNLNVRISRHDEDREQALPLYVGEAAGFAEVANLIERYDVKLACIDHLPEGRSAMALAEKFPGRVYLARFGTHDDVIKPDLDRRAVSARRTPCIDATFATIREQRRLLPGEKPPGYIEQMQALVRVVEEAEDGRMKVDYRAASGRPYDYAMAEVYDLLARELWLWRQAVTDAERGQIERLDDIYAFERAELDAGTEDTELKYHDYEPGEFGSSYEAGNFG